MAMATAIWAAAAEVTITDGAEDAVITTAGHVVIIVTITDTPSGDRFDGLRPKLASLRNSRSFANPARMSGVPTKVS